MKKLVFAIIAACIAAACSVPAAVKTPAFVPGWPDVGTPPATMARAAPPREM